jgi:hypothetical protein
MAATTRYASGALLLFTLLASDMTPARASLFTLAASGTFSFNSSGDSTIPVGTPWSFQLTYDAAAPDLDFELTGSPDATFGRFTNTAAPPALTFFHFRAGDYEVAIDDPVSFGAFSEIHVTFTSVNAIDVNINAPTFFPHLGGGSVSFHADFNAFSTAPIFSNDGLPTNSALGPQSFDQSTVTLLPPSGVVTGSILTSLNLAAGPAISADFDEDSDVDGADFLRWQRGGSPHPNDQIDLVAWKTNFGGAVSASLDSTAVPEPRSAALVILATLSCFVAAGQLKLPDRRPSRRRPDYCRKSQSQSQTEPNRMALNCRT